MPVPVPVLVLVVPVPVPVPVYRKVCLEYPDGRKVFFHGAEPEDHDDERIVRLEDSYSRGH